MSHDDALEALAAHPHAWRYRQLCEDGSDVGQRDAYRGLVVALARGERPAPPPAPPAEIRVDYGDPAPGPCAGCPGAPPSP